ncbi:variant leucine-rich repeat-containing protein [Lysinibacter cavernae]|uniref:Leucine rich repeat variant domain-containing protein n=1 Tax=Lysinibacter cavernae TaxID=1640652 RepID=A0A7X5QZJ4_9MICO|nr:hypothetical protein [Lysinibacter cavernae]NIH52849.1 hypothetical protein [Lysinibacter cavernae]
MAIAANRDSESLLGVFLSTDQLPTMHGAHGVESMWLASDAVFSSKRGLPPFVGARREEPQTVRGNLAIGIAAERIFGQVSPGSISDDGLTFSVPQGSVTVQTEGSQGLFSRRPRVVVLETAEWILTVEDVHEFRDGQVRSKAEGDFIEQIAVPDGSLTATEPDALPLTGALEAVNRRFGSKSQQPGGGAGDAAGDSEVVSSLSQLPNDAGADVRSPQDLDVGSWDELADQNTSPERLSEIAVSSPEVWSSVLAHPACYEGLRDWIAAEVAVAVSEASSPSTDPARLARLAQLFPELHQAISRNPACYPELAQWIGDYQSLE